MKFDWNFVTGLFYNYPQVQSMYLQFSSIQSIGSTMAQAVMLYEKLEIVDVKLLPEKIRLERSQEEEENETVTRTIARNSIECISGVYLVEPDRTIRDASCRSIDYLRDNIVQMDIKAIYVEIDETIHRIESIESLVMFLAMNRMEMEGLNNERRILNEVFYEEIFQNISIRDINTRYELSQEVRRMKPSLPEGIVQDVVDYIIATGAVVPA